MSDHFRDSNYDRDAEGRVRKIAELRGSDYTSRHFERMTGHSSLTPLLALPGSPGGANLGLETNCRPFARNAGRQIREHLAELQN